MQLYLSQTTLLSVGVLLSLSLSLCFVLRASCVCVVEHHLNAFIHKYVRDTFWTWMLLSCFDSISFGHWTIVSQFYDPIIWFGICSFSPFCVSFYPNTHINSSTMTFTCTKLTRNTHNWIFHSNFMIWSIILSPLIQTRFFFFTFVFHSRHLSFFLSFYLIQCLLISAREWWWT